MRLSFSNLRVHSLHHSSHSSSLVIICSPFHPSSSSAGRQGGSAFHSMELFAAGEKSSRLFRKRGGGSSKGAMEKGRSFSGRCARLVKEQRARFYIMRRCVTMLVCWREYA